MGINIENTVELVSERNFFTLAQIREFVQQTETWTDETKVFPGAGKDWSRLIAQYGDVTGKY
jgi:hypothetical protein